MAKKISRGWNSLFKVRKPRRTFNYTKALLEAWLVFMRLVGPQRSRHATGDTCNPATLRDWRLCGAGDTPPPPRSLTCTQAKPSPASSPPPEVTVAPISNLEDVTAQKVRTVAPAHGPMHACSRVHASSRSCA